MDSQYNGFHEKSKTEIFLKMCYEAGRTATAEQLSQAIRRYIGAAIDWIDALFSLINCNDPSEKVDAVPYIQMISVVVQCSSMLQSKR